MALIGLFESKSEVKTLTYALSGGRSKVELSRTGEACGAEYSHNVHLYIVNVMKIAEPTDLTSDIFDKVIWAACSVHNWLRMTSNQ